MKHMFLFILGCCLVAAVFGGCATRTAPVPVLQADQKELVGKKLHWQMFKVPADREGIDHLHCVFCTAQLVEAGGGSRRKGETDGYTTDDGALWVCNRCFDRLNPQFRWIEL